jgi:hypothetical protein
MQTKLTLRLEDALIRRAKSHARGVGKSVSEIVADYFARLEVTPDARGLGAQATSPAVRSLVGALVGAHLGESDYRDHLADKHR